MTADTPTLIWAHFEKVIKIISDELWISRPYAECGEASNALSLCGQYHHQDV